MIAIAACVGDDPENDSSQSADSGASRPDAPETTDAGPGSSDASVDADACNPTAPFGAPVQIVELSSSNNKNEYSLALSEDEKRVFFVSNRDGADRIFFAERATANGTFGTPARLDALVGTSANANAYVERVSISADEKTLYFSWSPDGLQDFKVWVAQRTLTTSPTAFSAPELVDGITEPQSVGSPFVNTTGTRLYYSAETAVNSNLFALQSLECTAPTQCGTRRSFPALGTTEPFGEGNAVVTRDEKTMYFGSTRDGGSGGKTAIYMTTRPDVNGGAFGTPELVLSVRPNIAHPGWVSNDGCRLYVASNQNGNFDLYVMTRPR